MAKTRRTRKQKKKRKRTRKSFTNRKQGHGKDISLTALPFDSDTSEALAPLFRGSEAQVTRKLTETLFESDYFADEPELEDFNFDPQTSALMFIKMAEELGWTADIYFSANEEKRAEMFSEIAEQIIPALLTDEPRQELLEGLEALTYRYQQRRQQKKAAQAAFIRLILADDNQKEMWPLVELIQRITSRSIEVGFAWMGIMDEIEQESSDLLDTPAELAQSGVMARITKKVERIPGLRRLAEKQFYKLMTEVETAVYNGTLHLGLFTENELTEAMAIMTKQVEPFVKEGQVSSDLPTEMGRNVIAEMDTYLLQLLTPKRLIQMQAHLHTILKDGLIDRKWRAIIDLLRKNLGEEDAVEMERPFLLRALMGELQVTMLTNLEEE